MTINILGFGLMGSQVAFLLSHLGFEVYVYCRNTRQDRLKRIKLLRKTIGQEIILHFVDQITALPNALTIECLKEDLTLKVDTYGQVRQNNNMPYCTNSSSYSPKQIGEDVVGLHFLNPISIKLIEVFRNTHQNTPALSQLLQCLKDYNYNILYVGNNPGYLVNVVLFHEIATAFKMVEQLNYSLKDLKLIYKELYGQRDIFTIVDVIGIEVVQKIFCNLCKSDERLYHPKSFVRALNQNIYGKKNKTSIKTLLQ